jgi:hypothetical protein
VEINLILRYNSTAPMTRWYVTCSGANTARPTTIASVTPGDDPGTGVEVDVDNGWCRNRNTVAVTTNRY